MKRPGNKGLITLILLTIAVCLTRLGKMPLMGTDEGMYGSASFNMLASGDYTIPRLGGLPFYDKPPLCYWLQAQS
ncbi:MAG: glycosyltransferase family 39 protein, partial [Abditibacteriota bacterium]|nr:glycosyltransferase family 39 protein [Abditibacteriota bacterium]